MTEGGITDTFDTCRRLGFAAIAWCCRALFSAYKPVLYPALCLTRVACRLTAERVPLRVEAGEGASAFRLYRVSKGACRLISY